MVGRLHATLVCVCLAAGCGARADELPPPPPMPACDAPSGAESVAREYQTMQMKDYEPGALKVGPVRDLGVFPASKSDNQYASREMFVKDIRYCEAEITLPDSAVDQVYWKIIRTFNVRSWLTPSTFCSLKHDVFQSKCSRYRPEGAVPAE